MVAATAGRLLSSTACPNVRVAAHRSRICAPHACSSTSWAVAPGLRQRQRRRHAVAAAAAGWRSFCSSSSSTSSSSGGSRNVLSSSRALADDDSGGVDPDAAVDSSDDEDEVEPPMPGPIVLFEGESQLNGIIQIHEVGAS